MSEVVILIGAPGSGKGTQSTHLVEKYGFRHTSAGDLLRAEVKAESPVGLKIKDLMNTGKLVSDEIVNGLMENVLKSLGNGDRLLLDGYPRSVEQAKFIDNVIFCLKNVSICVIQIDIDADSVVKRMSSRVMCEQCKTPYRAGEVERCAVCGNSTFVRRKDDEPAIVRERIDTYNSISSKVLDYYGDRVSYVNGDRSQEEVSQAIDEILACKFGFLN